MTAEARDENRQFGLEAGFNSRHLGPNRLNYDFRGVDAMRNRLVIAFLAVTFLLSASSVFAQAFGEYGRTVGNVPHGKTVTATKGSAGASQGKSRGGNVGQVGTVPVRNVPSRLVVANNGASLYPRQDEESQKLEQLGQGDVLTPMMQSAGGSDWYMVKTQKGAVGWVRSADVREDTVTK